jgi:predicted nicotinamide N-methyase
MENADLLIAELNAELMTFKGIELYVPDPESVRAWHERQVSANPAARSPFWAKLWPSSIAMAEFIIDNSSLIAGGTVLEIAGGLGLPALAAALYAKRVIYTDIEPAAVLLFSKLFTRNQVTNLEAFTLDWDVLPADVSADFLLLSDVNYDDSSFESLHELIHRFLDHGSVVILTTPMRLIGRDFILPLLPYAIEQQVKTITWSGSDTMITVLVLKRSLSV